MSSNSKNINPRGITRQIYWNCGIEDQYIQAIYRVAKSDKLFIPKIVSLQIKS